MSVADQLLDSLSKNPTVLDFAGVGDGSVHDAVMGVIGSRECYKREVEQFAPAAPIIVERRRQDDKWGKQQHPLPVWLTILTEEVGELAAAIMGHQFGNDDHPELDWRKEAIQVAAVALAMVESTPEE
jgi:hypothetical protein